MGTLLAPALAQARAHPLRTVLAVLVLALAGAGCLVQAALARGARAEAFRVAIAIGEGHLTLLPDLGGPDAPGLIGDAGPVYTHPALMRAGTGVFPRMTLPVAVTAAGKEERANLRGVERDDPQALLLAPRHLTGNWPTADAGPGTAEAGVVLGADLARTLGVGLGGTVKLRLVTAGAKPAAARVTGLVRSGRLDWDAHGAWSGLTLARAVRGLPHPRESEAVTHVAVFLTDPAASRVWRDELARMTLPDAVQVKEWWQLDLEPLRYAPQAEPGLPWSMTLLVLLVAGLVANLLLGPAPLPGLAGGPVPSERELRFRVLQATGVQALLLAAAGLLGACALAVAANGAMGLLGAAPFSTQALLPAGVERLGTLLGAAYTPRGRWGDAVTLVAIGVPSTVISAAGRLWRVAPLERG